MKPIKLWLVYLAVNKYIWYQIVQYFGKLGPVKRMRHSVRRVPYSICPHWTQLNSLICTQLKCSEMPIGKYFWALTCMQSILSEKYRWARFVRDEGECVRCVDSLPECPADSCIGRRLTQVLSSPKLPYLANTCFCLGPSFPSLGPTVSCGVNLTWTEGTFGESVGCKIFWDSHESFCLHQFLALWTTYQSVGW